jgi:O-succinylbenzoate synthase
LRYSVSPYELLPRGKISELARENPRAGALLKVEFDQGSVGYADIFPWPELGDATLGEQIEFLRNGLLTPLLRNTLEFAFIDSKSRAQGESLWKDLSLPLSHFLITETSQAAPTQASHEELESARAQGFDHFKIKLGSDPRKAAEEVKKISNALGFDARLRLDFNSALTQDGYFTFVNALKGAAINIDYIEDPTPWNHSNPGGFGVPETPFTLAVDREATQAMQASQPTVVVIKPALQDWKYCVRRAKALGIRPIFSSYLDHPVGQMFAAWASATSSPHETCGLLSHLAYEPNEFSERISHRGPRLVPPQNGTGIGFDDLLEKRAWKNV